MKKTKIQLAKHALSQKKYELNIKREKGKISKKDYKKKISEIDAQLDKIKAEHPVIRKVSAKSMKNLKRYNFIQSNLSSTLRESGVKIEKGAFRNYVKKIHDGTDEHDLRALKLDFDRIFQEYVQEIKPKKKEAIPFYGVIQELVQPEYDDFEIEVDYGEYSFKGTKEEFEDWYTEPDGLRSYLRNNYNNSPPAELVVEKKKGKKIKYRVETYDDTKPPTSREGATPIFKDTDLRKVKEELTARERELWAEKELIAEKRKLAENILEIKKQFPDMTIKEIKEMLGL